MLPHHVYAGGDFKRQRTRERERERPASRYSNKPSHRLSAIYRVDTLGSDAVAETRARTRGKQLSFGIDLRRARRLVDEEHGLHDRPPLEVPEVIRIVQTRHFLEEHGRDIVKLTVKEHASQGQEKGEDLPSDTHWIHIKSDCMNFDAFEAAARETPGLQDDDIGLILRLLKKVRATSEKRFVNGRYIEPVALGFNGSDPTEGDEIKSVVFFCLPYFSLASHSPCNLSRDSPMHPTRTLLQYHYRLESTAGRDKGQVIRRLRARARDEILHVPHIWCLLINKTTIVTCSPMSVQSLFGRVIQTVPYSKVLSTEGPSSVRFVDLEGRLYFFPIEKCKTWFELAQQVQQACPQEDLQLLDGSSGFTLMTKDDHPVTDKNWRAIVSSTRCAFIRLSLQYGAQSDTSSTSDYASESETSSSSEAESIRPMKQTSPTAESIVTETEQETEDDWKPVEQLFISDGPGERVWVLPYKLLERAPFNIAQDLDHRLTYIRRSYMDLKALDSSKDRHVECSDFIIMLRNLTSREISGYLSRPELHEQEVQCPSWVGPSAHRWAHEHHLKVKNARTVSGTPDSPHTPLLHLHTSNYPPYPVEGTDQAKKLTAQVSFSGQRSALGPRAHNLDEERIGETGRFSPPQRKRTVEFAGQPASLRSPQSPSESSFSPRIISPRERPVGSFPGRRDSSRYSATFDRLDDESNPGWEYVVPERSTSWGAESSIRGRRSRRDSIYPKATSMSRGRERKASKVSLEDDFYSRSSSKRGTERRRIERGAHFDVRTGLSDQASLVTRGKRFRQKSKKRTSEIYYVPPAIDRLATPLVSLPTENGSKKTGTAGTKQHEFHNSTPSPVSTTKLHEKIKSPKSDLNLNGDHSPVQRSRSGSTGSHKSQMLPVFMWPTAKPPSMEEPSRSFGNGDIGTGDKHVELTHGVTSPKEHENRPKKFQIDDETLALILQDANEQLIKREKRRESEMYRNTNECKRADVEKAIEILEASEPWPQDPEIKHVISLALKTKKDIVLTAKKISDAFVPPNFPCSVTDKYWGAVLELISTDGVQEDQLAALHEECLGLLNIIEDIQNGVSAESDAQTLRYQIPIALVRAYQRIVMFLVSCAAVASLISRHDSSTDRDRTFEIKERCLTESEGLLKEAKYQLILMIHTDEYQQGAGYEAVSSRALTILMMERLLQEPLIEDMFDLTDMYGQYLSKLEGQVQEHPSVSVFEDIKYLSEELEIVSKTMRHQRQTLEDYRELLGIDEYPKHWNDSLSGEVMLRSIDDTEQKILEFKELLMRAANIQFLAAQSISLKAESNNKAILLFTIVTIIFLPLSFVTSYLGMNTIDVRNSNSKQGLFWMIALPLACVILLVALFLAYQKPWVKHRRAALLRFSRWKND